MERQEYHAFPDFSIYEITFEIVTLAFTVTIIDVETFYGEPVYCGSKSNINFSEFICEYLCYFALKSYSIVCVLLTHLQSYTYSIIGLIVNVGNL